MEHSTHHIRRALPGDAQALVALIRSQHGATNPHEGIYAPAYLAQQLASEAIAAVLAEDEHGAVLGTDFAGKERGFSEGLAFYLLIVRPDARGNRLSRRMQQHLQDSLPLREYGCVYMHCLALNTINQQCAALLGYVPTGIMPRRFLFDPVSERAYGQPLPARRSHLMMCMAMAKRHVGALHIPEAYAGFITETYARLGVQIGSGTTAPGEIERVTYADHQYQDIFVEGIGANFQGRIERMLGEEGYDSANVFLTMQHTATLAACAILEELGCKFTGIAPLAGRVEMMIYHYDRQKTELFEGIAMPDDFRRQIMHMEGGT